MRVRGCEIVAEESQEGMEYIASDNDSDSCGCGSSIISFDGASVYMEGKKTVKFSSNFGQIVGTAVVSSFTDIKK